MAAKALTKAQMELLRRTANAGDIHCADYYAPANCLVSRGLAEWFESSRGSKRLRVTGHGLQTLAKLEKKERVKGGG